MPFVRNKKTATNKPLTEACPDATASLFIAEMPRY